VPYAEHCLNYVTQSWQEIINISMPSYKVSDFCRALKKSEYVDKFE